MVKNQGFAVLHFEKIDPLSILSFKIYFLRTNAFFIRKKFARSIKRLTLTHNYSIALAHTLLNLNNTLIQNEQILLHFRPKERISRSNTDSLSRLHGRVLALAPTVCFPYFVTFKQLSNENA